MANNVQVKICGLTNAKQAEDVAAAGADAIGIVFHGKSPRNVTIKQAQRICQAIPEHVAKVAVVVNMPVLEIGEIIKHCKVDAIQLHGSESYEILNNVRDQYGVGVIKYIDVNVIDIVREATRFNSAVLVEGKKGPLPGGNGMGWNWLIAKDLAGVCPFVLAGGLDPDNVAEAIGQAYPDAVDVSSGVEKEPGTKDIEKVKAFIENAKAVKYHRELEDCF